MIKKKSKSDGALEFKIEKFIDLKTNILTEKRSSYNVHYYSYGYLSDRNIMTKICDNTT